VTEAAFLIDSNIAIYALADAAGAAALRIQMHAPGTVVTSSIAYAEVLRGLGAGDEASLALVDAFFAVVPVLPFDRAAAVSYHRIPFRRGTFDRLIAAHALALDLTLVTNNEADFADIAGLRIENWTAPL
jgi:tRNA(fMet)-specific endonuclease VapC